MTSRYIQDAVDLANSWRDVPGFEGLYRVCMDGRVLSLQRTVTAIGRGGKPYSFVRPASLLRPCVNPDGYSKYTLYRTKRDFKTVHAHQLVLLTFVGERPDGHVGRHLDGNPANNWLSNLEYGTYAENCADSARHGTWPRGEKVNTAKLTSEQVLKIRAMKGRRKHREIAVEFGVAPTTVRDILSGKSWGYLAHPKTLEDFSSNPAAPSLAGPAAPIAESRSAPGAVE